MELSGLDVEINAAQAHLDRLQAESRTLSRVLDE